MSIRWTEEDTMKLVSLYRSYNFLWDTSMKSYRNLALRRRALNSIVCQMCKPSLTVQDVKSKIKNLRTTYYGERRRLAKIGETNSRKFPWFNAFKSLMEAVQIKKEQDETSVSDTESYDEILEESSIVEEMPTTTDAYVFSIKQEYLDEMENQDAEKDLDTVSEYLEPVPKKKKPFEPLPMKRAVQETQNEETVEEEPTPKRYDEFQTFANNVAAQLRKIPLDRALIIQVEVQSLIAKERIRAFKRSKEEAKENDMM